MKTSRAFALLLLIPAALMARDDSELGRPFLRSYSHIDDYSAHAQNWAVVQDRRGVMYFGNTLGVLEYDGVDWRLVPIPNGSIVRSLALDPGGRIWVGAVGELGYLAPGPTGELAYVSLLGQLPPEERDFRDVWFTYVQDDGIYFSSPRKLMRWRDGRFHTWQTTGYPHQVGGRLVVNQPGTGLTVLEGESFQLLPGGEATADLPKIFSILSHGDGGEMLLGLRDRPLVIFSPGAEPALRPFATEATEHLIHHRFYRGRGLPGGGYAFATMAGGVVIVEHDGRIRHLLDRAHGLRDNSVWDLGLDREGGLWLALNVGLARVDLGTPLTVFDAADGLDGTIEAIARHDGVLHVGTSLGLFALRHGRFEELAGGGPCWSLLSRPGGPLLAGTHSGVLAVRGSKVAPVLDGASNFYWLEASTADPAVVWAGSHEGLYRLRLGPGDFEVESLRHQVDAEIRSIAEDGDGGLWIGTYLDGVLHWSPDSDAGGPTLTRFGVNAGLPDPPRHIKVRWLDDRLLFATGAGLYEFDPASRSFFPCEALGPRFADGTLGVQRLTPSQDGDLWLRGIGVWDSQLPDWTTFSIRRPDGEASWTTGPLMRIGQAFNIFPEPGDVTWMGGTEGQLFRFDESRDKDYRQSFPVLVRRVVNKRNEVIFGGFGDAAPVVLEHTENAIVFHFAATSFDDESATHYSYLLDGFDDGFSPWTGETRKEYTNLPEGRYRFRVRAHNVYGTPGAEAEWTFEVRPPPWRTWWAYGLYALAVAGVLLLVDRRQGALARRREQRRAEVREARVRAAAAEREMVKARELEAKTQKLLRAEAQLVQSEKMAALGQLVAGLAHEINNPVNFISVGLPLARSDFDELAELVPAERRDAAFEKLRQSFDHSTQAIGEGASRAAEIVRSLRTFSRSDEAETQIADLHDSLDTTLALLAHETRDRIRVDKRYGELPVVECYAGELNQVFMNLLVNAVQAIPGEGTITVTTERGDGETVRIRIADDGCGMSEEARAKASDPFFTTKPVGVGTGLGLSISHGIVERHGGTITIESEPGRGTEVEVTLPLSPCRQAAGPGRSAAGPGRSAAGPGRPAAGD